MKHTFSRYAGKQGQCSSESPFQQVEFDRKELECMRSLQFRRVLGKLLKSILRYFVRAHEDYPSQEEREKRETGTMKSA